MTKKERTERILEYFHAQQPEITTELEFGSVFQLLCAVVLSAQCTDKRVNMVTPALFKHFPTPQEMAKAEAEDILAYISSVSYPNAKSLHLVQLARKLVTEFDGEVPHDFDALVSLPGVGRKTANVMLAVAFDQAAMPVDTHVFRVSHRLGLATKKSRHSGEGGTRTCETHSGRTLVPRPPLDTSPWQIHLHSKKSALQ